MKLKNYPLMLKAVDYAAYDGGYSSTEIAKLLDMEVEDLTTYEQTLAKLTPEQLHWFIEEFQDDDLPEWWNDELTAASTEVGDLAGY